VPHGFVIRLNREPLSELDADSVRLDREFWTDREAKTIGGWLSGSTSVQEVCRWVEKVHLRKDLTYFSGDIEFISTAQNWKGLREWEGASAVFAESRANIADLYAWRARNAKTVEENARMSAEADFAFRQAVALGPTQNDVAFGYYRFLVENNRESEALILVQTVSKFVLENKEEFVSQVSNAVERTVRPVQQVEEKPK
jgi:hypothetical protein